MTVLDTVRPVSAEYSTPSPFAAVTFLNALASGKVVMCEFKTLRKKWGYGKQRHAKHGT
jgi:hypothetical protein